MNNNPKTTHRWLTAAAIALGCHAMFANAASVQVSVSYDT